MRGGIDLHRRAEQREVADLDPADVEYDAVEVEEALLAEEDVAAIVAIKRRLHPDAIAARAHQLDQDATAQLDIGLAGGVEVPTQVAGSIAGAGKFRIEGVIQLACEHLVSFG